MPQLGPTSMMDPFVEGWAKEAGMETGTLSSILGGNIIGGLIEIPMDMFLTPLASKIMSFILGGAGLLLGTYTFKGQGRVQLDTMQIGSRIITEILDPSPSQIKEIQQNVGNLIDGVAQGRWDKIAYSFFRNPREFTGLVGPQQPPAEKTQEKPAGTPKTEETQQPGIIIRL